jgi:L-threonylcarbamoyladenylate synthase
MTEPRSQVERIDLAHADDRRDIVHRTVACLAQGGIVGLATETDYALAASALNPQAIARLRALQGPGENSPLTLLVKGPVEITDWVPNLSALGAKLARRVWPGPVTLQFPSSAMGGLTACLPASVRSLIIPDGTVALWSPAHPFLREVLRLLPAPLALGKGKAWGQREAKTIEVFDGLEGLAMIVDEGPATVQGLATSVRVDGDRWSVVQPGVVDTATIARMAGTILVFVCTGNTCRSPMAEALCKMLLAQRLGCAPDRLEERGYVVVSAGIATSNGLPPAAYAVDVVRARGASLQKHQSRQLTLEMVRQADYLIAMTNDHLDSLLDQVPECAPRARLLHPHGADIADPVGSDRETYQRTARAIEDYLGHLLDDLGI